MLPAEAKEVAPATSAPRVLSAAISRDSAGGELMTTGLGGDPRASSWWCARFRMSPAMDDLIRASSDARCSRLVSAEVTDDEPTLVPPPPRLLPAALGGDGMRSPFKLRISWVLRAGKCYCYCWNDERMMRNDQ